MTSPLSALRMFLSSQPYDSKRTNAGDEDAEVVYVTSVTPAPIKQVTHESKHDRRCNPCNPCNPKRNDVCEQKRDETRTGALAIIAEWRAGIVGVKLNSPEIEKLKSVSLRFLDSPDAITAVENEWDVLSLFGMHAGKAPRERIDCWGLVLFLAWGIRRATVETIDQKVCALRTRSGAVQTRPRNRAKLDEAVPWCCIRGSRTQSTPYRTEAIRARRRVCSAIRDSRWIASHMPAKQ